MSTSVQATLGKNFDQLAESFSPALTGGILNHLFEPIAGRRSGSAEVLRTRHLTIDYLLKTVKYALLHSTQSTEVLDVLHIAQEKKQHGRNHYLFGLVVAGLAILLSLGIWITLIVLPLCMRKKMKNSNRSTICYQVFGGLCLAFVLAAVLLTVFGFIATGALATSLNPNVRLESSPGERVSETIAFLVNQVPLLFDESIDNGIVQSQRSLQRVKKVFDEVVNKTISGVIADLLDAYNAVQLVDDARNVSTAFYSLGKQMAEVSKIQAETVSNLSEFLPQLDQYRRSIVQDLAVICQMLRGDTRTNCDANLANVRAIDLSFNSNQIQMDSIRIFANVYEFLNKHLSDMANGTNEIDHLFDRASDEAFMRISRLADIGELNTVVDSFWKSLGDSGGLQLKRQLQQIQPLVNRYNRLVYTVVVALGCTVFVIALLLLVVGGVYVILYSLGINDCPTCLPPPVVLTIVCAIFGFLICLAATFGVLVPIFSWLHNDVCRYVSSPAGSDITDAALNLWLEFEWARILQRLAPGRAELIQWTPPQNIFYALTSACGDSRFTGRNKGLLSLIGLTDVINVTAIFQLPVIKKAIQDNEHTVIQFVLDMNISSLIPDDLENQIQQFRNVLNTLDRNNYTDAINQLRNFMDRNETDQILQQLSLILAIAPPTPNSQRVENNIANIRHLLDSKYSKLETQIDRLIAHIEALSSTVELRPRINSLMTEIIKLLPIARDPVKLIKPIVPIYRKWTSSVIKTVTQRSRVILSHLVAGLFPCYRLYTMTTSVIQVTCGRTGEVSLLGSFSSLAVADTVVVLATMLVVVIFIYMMPKKG